MTGLDREAGSLVPFEGCASVVGDRAFAAELVKAPALARAFVVEGLGKFAALVERPAIAAVVDVLAEERGRTTQRVELGNRAEGQEVREHARDDDRNRRATRYVDDRFVRDDLGDRDRAGRVGVGIRQSAERCTGSDSNDGEAVFRGTLEHVEIADAGNGRVGRVANRNRAVNDEDVLALVFLLRSLACRLGRVARRGLQRVMVVERYRIENQRLDGRRVRACQRLGTSGAFLERKPDDRRPPCGRERFGDLRNGRWRQRHQRRSGRTEFQEASTGYALRPQVFAQILIFSHRSAS